MDKRVAFLKKQMLLNLRQSFTIEKMAHSVNLSESHLLQLFKREVGMPPVHYLWDLRLEKARELLEAEDSFENVKQIRFKVGIKDPSHFTRFFKAKYGLSPSEYRRRHWAKLEAKKSEASKS
ncbi:MAG: helix-turn-helix domain-containing protein [Pyrinomonadaceae bacterium]